VNAAPERARTHPESEHHLLADHDLLHHLPLQHNTDLQSILHHWAPTVRDNIPATLEWLGREPSTEGAEYGPVQVTAEELDALRLWHHYAHEALGFSPPPVDLTDDERLVTAWSRWPAGDAQEAGRWVIERSYPLRYWRDVLGLGLTEARPNGHGREILLFEQGVDPNEQALT
jgi:hypothetical protein